MELKSNPGSFQSSVDRESLMQQIQDGSANFRKEVGDSKQAEIESLGDITRKEESGLMTDAQRKSLNLKDTEIDDSEDLLSDSDVYGVEKKGAKPEDFAKKSALDSNNEEEKEVELPKFTELSDGTKICNNCGHMSNSPTIVEIDDHDIILYMMGAPISKSFDIGPIEIIIRSINEGELDYCGELMARDSMNEEFPTDIEYANRFSFYRLCFALVAMGMKDKTDKMIDPSSSKSKSDMESLFKLKASKLKSFGHAMRIKINQKQISLETSISIALDDEQRLKNL